MLKRPFWFFTLRLIVFLTGLFLCWLATDYDSWSAERLLTLTGGAGLIFISIAAGFSKVFNFPGGLEHAKSFFKYLIQSAAWILLVLIFVEIALRVLIYNPPFEKSRTNWAGDLPAEGALILTADEGFGLTWYQKWGEVQTPYTDNRDDNNIIILGDSHTEALEVGSADTFSSVAENVLRKEGYDADIHNMGHKKLALSDHISWIPAYRELYRPQVIVVQLTSLDFAESFNTVQYNYFEAKPDGTLKIVSKFDLSSGFVQKKRTFYNFQPQILSLGSSRYALMKAKKSGYVLEVPVDNPAESAKKFQLEMADQQIELLLQASRGTQLVVVLLPFAPYGTKAGIETADPAYQQMKKFLSQYPEIIIVDPLSEFQKLAASGHMPRGFYNTQPDEGHLNIYGHEIVGNLLAQTLEEILK